MSEFPTDYLNDRIDKLEERIDRLEHLQRGEQWCPRCKDWRDHDITTCRCGWRF